MPTDRRTYEAIRWVARFAWTQAGKPSGRDLEFWFIAEQFVLQGLREQMQ